MQEDRYRIIQYVRNVKLADVSTCSGVVGYCSPWSGSTHYHHHTVFLPSSLPTTTYMILPTTNRDLPTTLPSTWLPPITNLPTSYHRLLPIQVRTTYRLLPATTYRLPADYVPTKLLTYHLTTTYPSTVYCQLINQTTHCHTQEVCILNPRRHRNLKSYDIL
jgi:hypothetical protein